MTNPLKIYSGANALLYTTPVNIGCRRRVQLMNEDSITVKFSDKAKMRFPVGTRIGDFYITKEQQGKYNAITGGYDYELKFDAYYWLWANRLLFYVMPGVTNAPKETSFKLTATIDVHASVILRALNALGFTYDGSPFRVDTDEGFSTEAKYISYANMSILGGIQAIADAYECEWWVVGNAIHFGKCNAIGEYDFTVGENVAPITSDAKTTPANRLVVFGSTRNLPPNYRTQESSDVVDAVVVKRLMLPEGTPYLQTSPDIPEDEIVEEEVVLDSVYPRTALSVADVETYESTAQDGATQTFYRVKYGTAFHFSKDYILPDEELHIVFESGNLNGMDFAVKFNPLGAGEKKDDGSFNPEAQMLEIVVNEDYGRELPDGVLHPEIGDKFSLYGWDSTKMEDLGLLAEAEQELLTEGNKLIEEYRKDKQAYTCPMMWDWCKEQAEEGNTPRLGSVVNLHFVAGDTGRKSRIIGFEHDLDIEYSNVTYICGEKVSVSRLKTLESKVEGLTHTGEKVKVQNSLDFLSKRYSDRTPYGLSVGGLLKAEDRMHFGEFVSGFINGKGAGIGPAGDAEVESIVVRSYMKVFELIYNRLNAQEGEFSFADVGTIERVSEDAGGTLTATMRKRWDGDFTAFQPGDIVYGCVNDLDNKESKEHGKAWARVVSVNRADNTLTLVPYGDGDVPSGHNLALTQEMVITRWGNVISPSAEAHANPDYASFIIEKGGRWINTRQQSFFISCDQGNIVELMGVDSPVLREGNYGTVLGQIPEGLLDEETAKLINPGQPYLYARGIVVQDLIRIGYNGVRVRTPNFRGEWDAAQASGEGYHMTDDICDIVSHGGGMWQCCVETADCDPPSDASKSWARISGNDFSVWDIRPSANVIYIRAGGHSTNLLECTVTKNTGAGVAEFSTPETLDTEGKTLVFTLDGETYGEFWVREGDTVSGEDGLSLELEEGGTLDMGGNNVPWLEVGDYITLELREAGSSQALTKVMVPVVRDGADGGQGAKGEKGDPGRDGSDGKDGSHAEQRFRLVGYNGADPAMTEAERAVREPHGWEAAMPEVGPRDSLWMIQATVFPDGSMDGLWSVPVRMTGRDGEKGADGAPGKTGLMPYPCGKFDPLVTYRASGKATPVVMDGVDGMGMGQYYVLLPGAVYYAGDPGIEWKTPHEDAVNNGGHWERMDRFSSVFADIIMSEFGKIGSAVFSGDWMLSQQGVDDSGNYAENYESFGKGFTPNFSVDFKTGKVVARDIEFYGYARQKLTRITESNLKSYLLYPDDPWDTRALDWRKTGGSVWLEGLDRGVAMFMPDMKLLTNETEISRARMYAGVTGVIYNASDVDIAFSTCWRGVTPFGVTGGEMSDFQGTSRNTFLLASGEGVCMRCTLGVEYHVEKKQNGKYVKVVDNNGDEELVWDIETFFKIKKGES